MKSLKIVGAMLLAAIGLSSWIVLGHGPKSPTGGRQAPAQAASAGDLPWEIQVLPGGQSQVLGLRLAPAGQHGASTLADVRAHWGSDTIIAVIAAPGEVGTLEAFVDPAQAGFVSGKLVITAALPPAVLQGMRERALKGEFMESTTRKFLLSQQDMVTALAAPVTGLGFIPQANLDEAAIIGRFGRPAQRVRSTPHTEHFIYPERGLDVVLDTEGKELLQYVAPADIERLIKPLQAKKP
jgi:hypothetical protein